MLQLIKINANDFREALLEALAVLIVFLTVSLIGLVINYIKDIKLSRKLAIQERRTKKHRALEQEAEAMAKVYESIGGTKSES